LANEVATVTGGAQGIGLAIATRLAAEGATVAILDVNAAGAQAAAAALVADGRQAIGLACNVTSREQVHAAIAAVLIQFGRLSVLVNNAGIVRRAHFLEVTDAIWAEGLGVNLTGAFIVAQEVARVMVTQRSGRIVNMASVAAEIAHGNQTVYAVSKAGIAAMTRNMAFDLAPFGIGVNAIAPGLSRRTLPSARWPSRRVPGGCNGSRSGGSAIPRTSRQSPRSWLPPTPPMSLGRWSRSTAVWSWAGSGMRRIPSPNASASHVNRTRVRPNPLKSCM